MPLVLGFLAAIALETLAPIAAGFWAESRLDTPWRLFTCGALVFAVAQLGLRIPLVNWLARRLALSASASVSAVSWWPLFLAGSASLADQTGRYLGYRLLFRNFRRNWNNAVMYGLGYGGLESIFLVGLPSMVALANVVALPGLDPFSLGLSPQEARELYQAKREIASLRFWMPLQTGVESLSMLALQVSLSVLVAQVFLRSSWRWMIYALLLHFGAGLAVPLVDLGGSMLLAQVGLASVAGGAVYWALRLRPERAERT